MKTVQIGKQLHQFDTEDQMMGYCLRVASGAINPDSDKNDHRFIPQNMYEVMDLMNENSHLTAEITHLTAEITRLGAALDLSNKTQSPEKIYKATYGDNECEDRAKDVIETAPARYKLQAEITRLGVALDQRTAELHDERVLVLTIQETLSKTIYSGVVDNARFNIADKP